ncbi:2-amino-4-hydroxy-6-hydroxymethyldihydropteridine diphosphokinase [Chloroflexota bacterium]
MIAEMVAVYLGIGSNLGNRQANLINALDLLSRRLRVEKVSSVYDTEPIGNKSQTRFLNQVCKASTRLAPGELLVLAKGIELKMGRTFGKINTPRPIDIDILFYSDQIVKTTNLVIPHPRLKERAFVLIPLVEITPELVHPENGKTVTELLNSVSEVQGVFKLEGVSE